MTVFIVSWGQTLTPVVNSSDLFTRCLPCHTLWWMLGLFEPRKCLYFTSLSPGKPWSWRSVGKMREKSDSYNCTLVNIWALKSHCGTVFERKRGQLRKFATQNLSQQFNWKSVTIIFLISLKLVSLIKSKVDVARGISKLFHLNFCGVSSLKWILNSTTKYTSEHILSPVALFRT